MLAVRRLVGEWLVAIEPAARWEDVGRGAIGGLILPKSGCATVAFATLPPISKGDLGSAIKMPREVAVAHLAVAPVDGIFALSGLVEPDPLTEGLRRKGEDPKECQRERKHRDEESGRGE